MENLSDATVIVERMLVNYMRTSESERDTLLGADKAKQSWILVQKELADPEMDNLVERFEENPDQEKDRLVRRLSRFMNRNAAFANQLHQLYDEYLKEMYSGAFQIEQEFGQISNVAGATKGGTVIGVDMSSLDGNNIDV
jgi:hypothetical protein